MKQLASNYSFSGSTVTLTGVNVPLSQILLISDATTGNVLYSMAGPAAASYTQGTNSTITLATAPGSSDKLTVYYDDGVAPANAPTSVSVSNLPATQPVSGTVAVSNQPTSIQVSNFPASVNTGLSQPLTDTQLRASAVPVSLASAPLPTGAAQDGTDGTGITAPTGGSGIRGWLSGIYSKLSSALSVSQSGTWSIGRTWTLASANDSVTIQGGNSSAVKVDGSGVTQPVSIADGSNTAEGSKADSAATNSTSSWSVIALLKGLYAALTGTPSVGAVSATNTVSTTGIVPGTGNLLINSTDVSAYRSVTLQTTPSGGAAGAFQAQVSPDGTNWVYISGQSSAPSSSGSTTAAYLSGSGSNYLLASTTFSTFSLTGARYFRVYVTGGNGTGTVATTAFFSSLPVEPTLAQDSNNNLLVAGTMNNGPTSSNYAYSSSSTTNGTVIIGPLSCGTYRSLLLHVPQVSGSAAIQVSNDNSNWSNIWPILVNSATPMANVTGINQTGLFYAPLYGALYVRIILTSAITASSTWNAVLSQQSYPLLGVNATLAFNTPSPAPSTAQGFATYFTLVSASGTNATSVKASAGTIGTCVLTNTTASVKFVKLFNKASSPTLGTDTPVIQFPISANSTLDVSSSFAGLRLSTGIALATTGGSALLDNTSVAAGDVLVNMTYV